MKPPLRTKSVGTKVSEEEFAMLEARAQAAGRTLSEWVRDVLLAAPTTEGELIGEVALGELLALRTLLLNFFFRETKGEAIPEAEMRALIERADALKGDRARERIEAARNRAAKKAEPTGEPEPDAEAEEG
jgi:hypothetical protein